MNQIIRILLKYFVRQSWIRFGIRDRVLRHFHDPDTCLFEEFTTDFYGFKYEGNFHSYIDWSTYYYGCYEKGELKFMEYLLTKIEKPLVFDIGANIGHHSLFLSKFSNEIHSFEPYEVAFKRLKEKIKTNNLKNIKLNEFGLGERNESLEFYVPPENNQGIGSFVKGQIAADKSLILEIKKGDDYVNLNSIVKLDFIKIDIEGFEKYALMGLAQTIKKNRPIIMMEYLSAKESNLENADEIMGLLSTDYKIYQLDLVAKFFLFEIQRIKLTRIKNKIAQGNILLIPDDKLFFLEKFVKE